MQRLEDLLTLLFLLRACLILVEKTVQSRVIDEDVRIDEIQQREQLFQNILEQSPRDEQPTVGDEDLHDLGQERVDILYAPRR